MSRLFYHVMQDNAGNLLFDVSGTMRLAGTGTLATIYGDEALTVICQPDDQSSLVWLLQVLPGRRRL